VTRRRLRLWAMGAIVASVLLWVAQALIGLNLYDEEEAYPWFLRALQWIALALVLASLPVLMWTLMRSPRRDA
jgi:hypothetical protein